MNYSTNSTDCDSNDRFTYPGATELCDNKDNNCNYIDDEPYDAYYSDFDGDSWADPTAPIMYACEPYEYYTITDFDRVTDCDDNNASVNPMAIETCDNIDNNCFEGVDEICICSPGQTERCYSGPIESIGVGECNAGRRSCNASGQWEACDGEVLPTYPDNECDGLDNDCNGIADEDAGDSDFDGISTCDDNCPNYANPDQNDIDDDEVGDICDNNCGEGTIIKEWELGSQDYFNGSKVYAYSLCNGLSVQGRINTNTDYDWFKIQTFDAYTVVDISVVKTIIDIDDNVTYRFKMEDASGTKLFDEISTTWDGVSSTYKANIRKAVPAGSYYLYIYDYGGNNMDTDDYYNLQIKFADTGLECEPNDTSKDATLITEGSINASIGSYTDVDWYKIDITGEKLLNINVTGLACYDIEVYKSDKTTIVIDESNWCTTNKTFDDTHYINSSLDGGITYYIKIQENYNANWGAKYTFTLSASDVPDGNYEPNDAIEQAVQISLDTPIEAGIYSHGGDVDWYKIDISGEKLLKMNVTGLTCYNIEVRKSDKTTSVFNEVNWCSLNKTFDDTHYINSSLDGGTTYYIKIQENYNANWGARYTFMITANDVPNSDIEPNNDWTSASNINLNIQSDGSSTGSVTEYIASHGDVDWYKFETYEESILEVEIKKTNGNNTFVDFQAEIYVYDESKHNAIWITGGNCSYHYLCNHDGTPIKDAIYVPANAVYYISIQDYQANEYDYNNLYTLSVNLFNAVRVQDLTDEPNGNYYYSGGYTSNDPSGYSYYYWDALKIYATHISTGTLSNLHIASGRDEDWYKINLSTTSNITINIKNTAIYGSAVELAATLFNSSESKIEVGVGLCNATMGDYIYSSRYIYYACYDSDGDLGGVTNFNVTYNSLPAGDYYLIIYDYQFNEWDYVNPYSITITSQ